MKFGTRLGCILVAFSIILSVWVISGVGSKASQTENGYTVDDTGQLIAYPAGTAIIDIPTSINGQEVTSIAGGLFADNKTITSVSIPDSVKSIGTAVFSGCSELSSVRLSGEPTFQYLPQQTFYNCKKLTSIDLKNVVNIGSEAFRGSGLTSITLPAGTAGVSTDAFDECSALTSIDVISGNFASYDGCLYSSGQAILIRCPEGKTSITLSDSCTSIGKNALSNCKVSEITIPRSVNSIDTQANWPLDVSTALIHGYADTEAENFANLNGISFDMLDSGGGGGTTTWTVTFDVNGGAESYSSQTVNDGDKASNPGTPTKTGATFNGWYYGTTAWDFDNDTVTTDMTLTANWTESGSTDNGNSSNGSNSGNSSSSNSSSSSSSSSGTSSTDKTYTVTFDLNGGTGNSAKQTIKAGGYAKNPGNPTKNGATFMGWDYGSPAGDLWNFDTYQVNFNVKLTAVWKNADGSISKGNSSSTSGGSSGNGGHVKDSTPKTADGDLDPRYFLSLSFLLVGIAAILYSKRQKTQMIAERRKR